MCMIINTRVMFWKIKLLASLAKNVLHSIYIMCFNMYTNQQAIRDLVKSARKSGNQAFSRLQKRIFRLEKKDQHESGVTNQEGDNNMGRKSLRPDSGPDIPLPSYDDIYSCDLWQIYYNNILFSHLLLRHSIVSFCLCFVCLKLSVPWKRCACVWMSWRIT